MMSPQRKHAKRRNKEARSRQRLGVLSYKASSAMDAGCFFVPYVPLQMVGRTSNPILVELNEPGRWRWKMPARDVEEVNDAITWAYDNAEKGSWTLEVERDFLLNDWYCLEFEKKEDATLFKMFLT